MAWNLLSIYSSRGTDFCFKTISSTYTRCETGCHLRRIEAEGENVLYSQYARKRGWTHRSEPGSPMIPRLPPGTCKHRRHSTFCQSMSLGLRHFFLFTPKEPWKGRSILSRRLNFGLEFHGQSSRTVDAFLSPGENRKYYLHSRSVARAQVDINFSKFYNIDSRHARNNVLRGNFCVAREIIMIIRLEARRDNWES